KEDARTTAQVNRAQAVEENAEQRMLDSMVGTIARHVHAHAGTDGCQRTCMTPTTRSDHRRSVGMTNAIEEPNRRGFIIGRDDPARRSQATYWPGPKTPRAAS